MSATARTIARTHKILGLVIGVQLLFWTLSGFYFTLFPIEQIRGEHLRKPAPPLSNLEGLEIAAPRLQQPASNMDIRALPGGPAWFVQGDGWTAFHSLETGEAMTPLSEADVRAIALAAWAGDGELVSVSLVEDPPREAFSEAPLWRVQFEGEDKATFWVDARQGRVTAVRTGEWRLFDVLWRFHIMDVTGDDRFDSWWLKLAAFLGLTTVLFGLALLVHRASRGRLFR